MKFVSYLLFGLIVLSAGCATTSKQSESTGTKYSVIGTPVDALVKAHWGQRMEFFDANGKQVRWLPRQGSGSVSIHTKDETGQDNYAFDDNGIIVKHRVSHGDDYKEGKWRDAK